LEVGNVYGKLKNVNNAKNDLHAVTIWFKIFFSCF